MENSPSKAARYSELELKYARPIADALANRPDFLAWVLTGTRHEALAEVARHDAPKQQTLRGQPKMKNPYWFNYWCGKDGACTCRLGTAIETDILLIFECQEVSLAVHVEVKRPGEKLGVGQAATYPRRAACWATGASRPKRIPPHTEFLTVLVCGENLIGDAEVVHFDKVILHNDIAQRIAPYPEA
jgi:hypothetical protein